jgi:hypothetical protein
MTDEEALFGAIVKVLKRRNQVSVLNPESGTFDLRDEDRTVRVTLELNLLAEFFDGLDEDQIPGLSYSPLDEQDRVRVKRIAMWIDEIFGSDIFLSLLEIRLSRSADGRISLVDRRGVARRSLPSASTEGGYWSPDRPGT